jgi:AraC-like DNA-binding protein
MDGFSRIFRPSAPLADIVEAIWNWEIADPAAARCAVSITLPSPFPVLSVHYGEPMWSDRPCGSRYYRQIATGIQTGVVTFRPSGPAGCVLVRLKPDAAARIVGAAIPDFTDTNIVLEDIFGAGEIALLQESLKAARGSHARIASIETFLLSHLRDDRRDSVATHAALLLRRDPSMPVHELAGHLAVSRRHLHRAFQAMFGIGPKQFGRIVRIGRLLAARRERGLSWAEAAYACGFADQSHMINEFTGLVGVSPQEFFRAPTVAADRGFNASLAESHFSNQFFSS